MDVRHTEKSKGYPREASAVFQNFLSDESPEANHGGRDQVNFEGKRSVGIRDFHVDVLTGGRIEDIIP